MGGMLLGLQAGEPASARALKTDEPVPKFVPESQVHHDPPTKPKDAAEAREIVIRMCKEGALIEEMAAAASRAPSTVKKYIQEAGLAVPMAGPSIRPAVERADETL
jgi:DNA-binding NarL/FixJ family response regulator